MPLAAAGGRRKQPRTSQRDANPAHRASASASLPWLPARPDRNFTWRAQPIAQTMSAWRYSAISARDGSRSVTANCMRHHPQQSRHPRQPKSKIIDEADLDRGQVSWLSPIARALMKAHQGDIVDLLAPAGVDQIEVLAIRYGVADSKAYGRLRLFG